MKNVFSRTRNIIVHFDLRSTLNIEIFVERFEKLVHGYLQLFKNKNEKFSFYLQCGMGQYFCLRNACICRQNVLSRNGTIEFQSIGK